MPFLSLICSIYVKAFPLNLRLIAKVIQETIAARSLGLRGQNQAFVFPAPSKQKNVSRQTQDDDYNAYINDSCRIGSRKHPFSFPLVLP